MRRESPRDHPRILGLRSGAGSAGKCIRPNPHSRADAIDLLDAQSVHDVDAVDARERFTPRATAPNQPLSRTNPKPSDGLEPSTPSLPSTCSRSGAGGRDDPTHCATWLPRQAGQSSSVPRCSSLSQGRSRCGARGVARGSRGRVATAMRKRISARRRSFSASYADSACTGVADRVRVAAKPLGLAS
jgi:hypothetical protein